jgi:hypothetical protein
VVTLEQARGDLGVVTSRGNTGGVQAVQWALPSLLFDSRRRRDFPTSERR